jgi:hypothetical protein
MNGNLSYQGKYFPSSSSNLEPFVSQENKTKFLLEFRGALSLLIQMTMCRLDGLTRGGIPRGNLVEVVGDNFSKLSLVRRVALDPLTCPGSDRSLSCCLFCSFGTICPSLQLWSRHTGEPVLISLFTDLSLADREIHLQCPEVGRPEDCDLY